MSLQPSSLSLLFIRVRLLFGDTINASLHMYISIVCDKSTSLPHSLTLKMPSKIRHITFIIYDRAN